MGLTLADHEDSRRLSQPTQLHGCTVCCDTAVLYSSTFRSFDRGPLLFITVVRECEGGAGSADPTYWSSSAFFELRYFTACVRAFFLVPFFGGAGL